ncbi:MAG: leucine-rich repeat domain-containing protein [Bacteroidales bacterium]|nr:leucine-rich repeat domain-containing protein [Bacteroidales bacterium]
MKSILFTTLFLCSAITAMAADDLTEKYTIDGTEYTFTFMDITSSRYVKSISDVPTSESFTFPTSTEIGGDIDGLYKGVMILSTSKYVTLGEKMTYLGGSNFSDNTSLITITGVAIVEVSGNDFKHCTSLTTVTMPELQIIGSSAFVGCTALSSISFPKIATIKNKAFQGCTALKSIYLGNLSNVENDAFADCNFATTKPSIRVKCENTDENKTSLTTIFGVSEWAYDSESGVMYAVYSEPVTKYSINISNSIVNGRVEADAETAAAGTLVTLTATPSDDYLLVEFIVTDAESNSVTVSDDGKFTMPANDVTISAIFAKNTVTATCGAINVDDAEIVVAGNKIVASGNGVLTVYDILGKQVLSAEVSGREAVALAKGIYIVKFAGKTTKIVLK